MAFHEIDFPLKMGWGSEFGMEISVALTQKTSGAEQRIQRWGSERRVYNAARAVNTFDSLLTLRNFWRARSGSTHGFRLLDPFDFSTAIDSRSAPSATDMVLGTGDGTKVDFQLVARYSDPVSTLVRNIEKPRLGVAYVAVDDVVQSEGVDFTVNYATGIVTFDAGSIPAMAANVTGGCEYDTPVRFGSDSAAQWRASNIQAELHSLQIPMVELFGAALVDDDGYRGGGSIQTVTADMYVVRSTMGETIRLQPTAARTIYLESPAALEAGHRLTLWNDNASAFSLTVKALGATVATLTAGTVADFHVFKTTSSQEWKAV